MRLLLHSCCAPCSGAIVECLLKEGVRPTLFYCNPNIYPEEEYLKRKNECSRFAAECGLEFIDDDYDHGSWLKCTAGLEECPERGERCAGCCHYRLLRSARYALSNGFDTLATTLASSRWKNLSQVNAAGERAVEQALSETPGAVLAWWGRNWRKGGLQERRNQILKEKNFYNQLYCGCEFSFKNR